jgi:bromodomain-containing factor 1
MSIKEIELATPSHSEFSNEAESNKIEIMSTPHISTPVASPSADDASILKEHQPESTANDVEMSDLFGEDNAKPSVNTDAAQKPQMPSEPEQEPPIAHSADKETTPLSEKVASEVEANAPQDASDATSQPEATTTKAPEPDKPLDSATKQSENATVAVPVETAPSMNTQPTVNNTTTTNTVTAASSAADSTQQQPDSLKRVSDPAPESPSKKIKTESVLPPADEADPAVLASLIPSGDSRNPPPGAPQELAKHQLKFALASIRAVKRLKDAGPFLAPVDIVKLNIPTYLDFIKNPMDLGTMEAKINNNVYKSATEFVSDMDLIVSNCELFNGRDSEISQMARNIRTSFAKHVRNLPPYDQPAQTVSKSKRKTAAKPARAASVTPKPSTSRAAAPKPAASATTHADSKPFQAPGVPTIRRDSAVDSGRPKREIHPPRSKDILYDKPRRKKYDAELKFCGVVLRDLLSKKHEAYSYPFLDPVDPVALNCPNYFDIVKYPMDLSTIQKKYAGNEYDSADEFEADIRLMFNNCYKFNPEGAPVNLMGHRLEAVFDKKWQEKPVPTPVATPAATSISSDEEKSGDEDDEAAVYAANPAIRFLEDQLDRMQKELNKLKREALKEAREKAKPKSRKKSTGGSNSGAQKKDAVKRKPGRKPSNASNTSFTAPPVHVTYEMKKELSESMATLTEAKMMHVLTIIRESMPHINAEQEEIELDMESLTPETLLKLYNYVVHNDEKARANGNGKAVNGEPGVLSTAAVAGRGKGGVAKKGKPLTEAEQSRQIEEIQKKIEQFDRVESGGRVVVSSDEDDEDDDDDSSSSEEE